MRKRLDRVERGRQEAVRLATEDDRNVWSKDVEDIISSSTSISCRPIFWFISVNILSCLAIDFCWIRTRIVKI